MTDFDMLDIYGSGLGFTQKVGPHMRLKAVYKKKAEVDLPDYLLQLLKSHTMEIFYKNDTPTGLLSLEFKAGKNSVYYSSAKTTFAQLLKEEAEHLEIVYAIKDNLVRVEGPIPQLAELVGDLHDLKLRNRFLTLANVINGQKMAHPLARQPS